MSDRIDKERVSFFIQKYALVLIVLIMCAIVAIATPVFLTPVNILNVLRQVSINGIIAVGMTFILLSGQIDISVGSLVAVSGVVTGSIVVVDPGSPVVVILACLAGVFSCMVLGFFSGSMVAIFNVPPMIATLAMMTIGRGIALAWSNGAPFQLFEKGPFEFLGKGVLLTIDLPDSENFGLLPAPVLLFILVFAVFWVVLNYTRFGRYAYAVGGNRRAAEASGVSSRKTIISVFMLSGALAGFAGVVLASRIGAGQPAIGVMYEMDAIAACVIGGTSTLGGVGKLSGTLIGVLIIGLISNILTLLNIDAYAQQIVKGLIISLAVILDMQTKKKGMK